MEQETICKALNQIYTKTGENIIFVNSDEIKIRLY